MAGNALVHQRPDSAPVPIAPPCRLCHWTFDEGLLSLSAVYVILASPQLSGNGNVPAHLGALVGRLLVGPAEEAWRPDLEAVGWHRERVFRRR